MTCRKGQKLETEFVKLDSLTEEGSEDAYRRAGEIIRNGGMVAFPTETVYGLGANALDAEAAAKIYAAKGRPSDNPLIAHIAKEEMLYELAAEVPEKAKVLMKAFWPGPLTMVFHKKDIVPDGTTGGLKTVAVRMPDHPVALELIRQSDRPIAAPSANISGRPSPTSAKRTVEDMNGRIDMILDGGDCRIGIESTIIDMTEEIPMILRPGFITPAMFEALIGPVRIDPAILKKPDPNFRPKAPGQMYRHYAPNAPMYLIEGKDMEKVTAKISSLIRQAHEDDRKAAVLCTEESKKYYEEHGADVIRSLGSRDHIESVARNLYEILREFNELEIDVIYSETFVDEQFGSAIMNRMVRAAGHNEIQVD